MSQKRSFSAPFKSPFERRTADMQTSGKNGIPQCKKLPVIDRQAASNVIKPSTPKEKKSRHPSFRKNGTVSSPAPKTPTRTPVFQLYGIKSPYNRGRQSTALTPSGQRYSFLSSQASSPGISPARLIKNFSQKMRQVDVFEQDCSDSDAERTGSVTLSQTHQPRNDQPPSITHKSRDDQASNITHQFTDENNNSSTVQVHCQQSPELAILTTKKKKPPPKDVYDMELSLEPVKKCVNRKQKKERQKTQQVLAVIRKMHKEFTRYQQRYDSLMQNKMVQEKIKVPITSLEVVYCSTQSQKIARTQDDCSLVLSTAHQGHKPYSRPGMLPLNGQTQESILIDPMEE